MTGTPGKPRPLVALGLAGLIGLIGVSVSPAVWKQTTTACKDPDYSSTWGSRIHRSHWLYRPSCGP